MKNKRVQMFGRYNLAAARNGLNAVGRIGGGGLGQSMRMQEGRSIDLTSLEDFSARGEVIPQLLPQIGEHFPRGGLESLEGIASPRLTRVLFALADANVTMNLGMPYLNTAAAIAGGMAPPDALVFQECASICRQYMAEGKLIWNPTQQSYVGAGEESPPSIEVYWWGVSVHMDKETLNELYDASGDWRVAVATTSQILLIYLISGPVAWATILTLFGGALAITYAKKVDTCKGVQFNIPWTGVIGFSITATV